LPRGELYSYVEVTGKTDSRLAWSTATPPVVGILNTTFVAKVYAPGSTTPIVVPGFYDGPQLQGGILMHVFAFRIYGAVAGLYSYRTVSSADARLHGITGALFVDATGVPQNTGSRGGVYDRTQSRGKLRISALDPTQFMYDNGFAFVHIGDEGFRYATTSPFEMPPSSTSNYLEQAVGNGATKIRTWLAAEDGSVRTLFDSTGKTMDFDVWRAIETRLLDALALFPHVQLQVIVFGSDWVRLRAAGRIRDPLSLMVATYAQARWSSLPNVHFCITNDPTLDAATVRSVGETMRKGELWGTLITRCGALRRSVHLHSPLSSPLLSSPILSPPLLPSTALDPCSTPLWSFLPSPFARFLSAPLLAVRWQSI
jgi:hypothetical protein